MLRKTGNIVYERTLSLLLNNSINKVSSLNYNICLFHVNRLNSSNRSIYTNKDSYIKDVYSQIKSGINEDKEFASDLNKFINNFNIQNKLMRNKGIQKLLNMINSQKTKLESFRDFSSYYEYLYRYGHVCTFILDYMKLIKTFFDDETEQDEVKEKLLKWKNLKLKDGLYAHISDETPNSDVSNSQRNEYDLNKSESKKNERIQKDNSSIIVQEDSVWDRFGTKLKDMPVLKDFFENPFIGKIFRESEVSNAIKHMKILDPKFKLFHLFYIVENIVVPHYLTAYLSGSKNELKLHTADTAFRTLSSRIDELKSLGLNLDPTITFIGNLELKGAKISKFEFADELSGTNIERIQPVFIFTFTAQQINCLRNSDGEIVSGSKDDIREVSYSIAVTHHPNNGISGLEYPFLITELAILGVSPIF